jgi:hypothetical protein
MKLLASVASISTKLSVATMVGMGFVATIPEQPSQTKPNAQLDASSRSAEISRQATPAIEVHQHTVVPVITIADTRRRDHRKAAAKKHQQEDEAGDAAADEEVKSAKDKKGKSSATRDPEPKDHGKSSKSGAAGDKDGKTASETKGDTKKVPDADAIPVAPAVQPPPPPDVWSEQEIIAALQQCLKDLAPIAAEIEIDQPMRKGQCGAAAPVDLKRIGQAPGPKTVVFQPPVTINCKMVVALNTWVQTVLQPKAVATFGSPVTRIIGSSGYSCRNRYGLPNTRLSEHAKANAIDIGGFVLADGRRIQVLNGWGPTRRDLLARAKELKDGKQKNGKSESGKESGKGGSAAKSGKAGRHGVKAQVIPIRASEGDAKSKTTEMRVSEASPLGAAGKLPEECSDPVADTRAKKKRTTKSQRRAQAARAERCAEAEAKRKAEIAAALPPAPDEKELSKTAKFLRELHAGACGVFGTVLGPEANAAHRNHFHFDLTPRKRKAFCE